MRTSRARYDVAVIGAGPAGVATALAFAQRGASVALLEADPRGARRFAGEWLHPTGVAVLDELRVGRLEAARARAGYGFVILPDDRSEPIEMPYEDGVALSAEHHAIVDAMRDVARDRAGVEYVPNARVRAVDRTLLTCEDRDAGTRFELSAGRIVGAEGRASIVRKAMGAPDRSAPISSMAAVELRDVRLPREGFGHVVLGGPGPALFYRIGDDVVRGCLDVPAGFPRTPSALWDAFHAVLPEPMRAPFRAALEAGPLAWAALRFRPRHDFGAGPLALVGDALGHVHPMTAIGMTMGLLDARALAASKDLAEYERTRRADVPELLSNALYHCFRRDDASATQIRRAMFATLRASATERRRTMAILGAADTRRRAFGTAFLEIAARAIGGTARDAGRRGELASFWPALAEYGEWMQWPGAVAVPRALQRSFRGESTPTHPLPFLASFVRTRAPLALAADAPQRASDDEVDLRAAIGRSHDALLGTLEEIARVMGSVPDEAIAGTGMHVMRAITAGPMRPGIAARATIGRRHLAALGVPRMLSMPAWSTRELAELLLVLLAGEPWPPEPITQLAEAVRALLDRQTIAGGFAAGPGAPTGHPGDLESTALVCRALDALLRARPEASDADVDASLSKAAEWVRRTQRDDGGWPSHSPLAGPRPDDAANVANAIEALLADGDNPGEAAVRRAIRWLADRGETEGGWSVPEADEAAQRVTAAVLRALCAAHATVPTTAATRALVACLDDEGLDAEVRASITLALSALEVRREARPARAPRARSSSERSSAADWDYCKHALGEVSRTFSRPIALLPSKLEVAVTLGYLLCRIADTVEDHAAVPPEDRDRLFELFLATLERGAPAAPFEQAFEAIEGDDAELSLARRTSVVMRVFAEQSESTRTACVRWVAEMTRGMSLYSHRPREQDGFVALSTTSDLERYCYYVAGTVGHLLTDLFLEELGPEATPERALALREDAEGFAMGLQLVNVLKDVTDDRERAWSFVPRTAAARQGLGIAELCEPSRRDDAHAAVSPLFDVARRNLDAALRYALAIPPSHVGIRLFCLLPLWMAARTLVAARGNDAMFVAGAPVKISREEVESIIATCMRNVGDDDALRAAYATLYDRPEVASAIACAGQRLIDQRIQP